MKIDKAIEALKFEVHATLPPRNDDLFTAIKLGIEALKRLQKYRRDPCHVANILLPGETTEEES